MKPASGRFAHHGPAVTTALLGGLILLPAAMLQANAVDHGLSEFRNDARAEDHAQPYFDADPDSYYTPVLRGSPTSRLALTDLFSGGGSGASSAGGGGGGGGGAGGGSATGGADSFGAFGGNGSSKANGTGRANPFSSGSDDSSNSDLLLSRSALGNEPGSSSLSSTAQNGGYDVRSTIFPQSQLLQTDDIAQLLDPKLAATAVPETLPALLGLMPLLLAVFVHRRLRSS